MSRGFFVEPEAEAEIAKAAEWYDLQNPAACVGFSRAIDRAFELIRANPDQYQIVYREFRRALVEAQPVPQFFC